MTQSGSQAEQVLMALGARGSDGASCQEIERTLKLTHRTVSARLRELELSGHATKTARTRRIFGGRLARVHAITQAGARALAERRES